MIKQTYIVGINHHVSSEQQRSSYALDPAKQDVFYAKAKAAGLYPLSILNTCNRTEVYGHGNVQQALEIYRSIVGEEAALITLQGEDAVQHMFKVAAGIDSQVIGDLEILGQFKDAFHLAKQKQSLNGYLERLANVAVQAAKEVRSKTKISSGTVSLAYAVTKYIRKTVGEKPLHVLLIGTGDFGKSIARNIHDYLPQVKLTLCNRTRSRAEVLASQLKADIADFETLPQAIVNADIIITALHTGNSYLLGKELLESLVGKARIFIDMSIPLSIDPELSISALHQVLSLNDVAGEVNDTLSSRLEELPLAHAIIHKHALEFINWAALFEKSGSIKEWKEQLSELSQTCPYMKSLEEKERERIIGKNVAAFAHYLKANNTIPPEQDKLLTRFLKECDKAIPCKKADHPTPPDCNACSQN